MEVKGSCGIEQLRVQVPPLSLAGSKTAFSLKNLVYISAVNELPGDQRLARSMPGYRSGLRGLPQTSKGAEPTPGAWQITQTETQPNALGLP